ncbi:MAG: uracil-xanthine permease [Ruminococcaceae bacterium]|nr:uracil-xanthine permease [Oscillospiraceae bacterium]
MKLIYDVNDKPKFSQLVVFAIQQLLAIMAATLVVPVIVGNGMSSAAALFGAGCGTLVYILFTKRRSPVFLGSSFAFIGSMSAAFAGAASAAMGYLGIIIGAILAGLVYVVIAIIIKFAGVKWIAKLMPSVVIGPVVAIIGLSLAGNAVGDLQKVNYTLADGTQPGSPFVAIIVGLITLAVTMIASVYGKKMARLIPFILGILAGYAAASIFYVIGVLTGNGAFMIIDYSPLVNTFSEITVASFVSVPDFTFITALGGFSEISGTYIASIAMAYMPVAFVVFAEHIADHKNLSTIVNRDLLEDPGLSRTLLGDGVGSMVGALFGGCPNTTYGESVGCVAITKNASVYTIIAAAIGAIIISFITPFVAFVNSIPSCVMGGICMALYGFIAVSGLKMLKDVNLDENKNLFVASVILISGIGGLTLSFNVGSGTITITAIACALILGILTNVMLSKAKSEEEE